MSRRHTPNMRPMIWFLAAAISLSAGCVIDQETPAPEQVHRQFLPVEWARGTDAPCLQLGEPGSFDSDHLFAPCVFTPASTHTMYRMLYCGSGPQEGRLFKIGVAESTNGVDWEKRAGNPILQFPDGKTSLVTPALARSALGMPAEVDGDLVMYVVAVDFTGDNVHRLYRTTSDSEGLAWSRLEGPLMENVYAPSVIYRDGEYRMWYVDVTVDPWCVRVSRSEDGFGWQPVIDEPVLQIDQEWERGRLFYPYVMFDGARYVMFYGSYWSARDKSTAIGLAVSEDGILWDKYKDNPIICPDVNRPWESNYCTSHTVSLDLPAMMASIFTDQPYLYYRIWYATRNEDVQKHKYFAIGTALSVPPMVQAEEPIVAQPGFSMSAKRANDKRLEPLHFLDRYGKSGVPEFAFQAENRRQWKTWHADLREALSGAIGLDGLQVWPGEVPAEQKLRVTPGPVDQCKGYKRMAFTIETAPGLFVPAFLLVPDDLDEPRPAILCSHGHGIGMNALVGLTEDGNPRPYKQGYQHDFALQAVKAGFVALAWDQMGFGRRRDVDFNKAQKMWNQCEQPSKNALHWGMSMTGIRVWDAMRMVDFLQTRPEVDANRIGMVGISGGGLVTQFTAALDDRIKAACVSGFCNRFADSILALHHCVDNYVPGLGRIAENDDIACLVAPRPLLIEGGKQDPIFPIAATRAAVRKLRGCYRLLGVGSRLEVDLFDGPHEFSGAKTWTFFARHLGQ